MHKYIAALTIITCLFFCNSAIAAAADKAEAKQPTEKELSLAIAETTVVRSYLQQQLDAWTARLVRLQDQAAAAQREKAAKKPLKSEPPKPDKATSVPSGSTNKGEKQQ